jgi:nucleoid DNA-binding protein
MLKKDIVDICVERHGLSRASAKQLVNDLIFEIQTSLKKGETVHLSGFGTFDVMERKARKARNPRTGETFVAGPGKRIRFKASPKLKNLI